MTADRLEMACHRPKGSRTALRSRVPLTPVRLPARLRPDAGPVRGRYQRRSGLGPVSEPFGHDGGPEGQDRGAVDADRRPGGHRPNPTPRFAPLPDLPPGLIWRSQSFQDLTHLWSS